MNNITDNIFNPLISPEEAYKLISSSKFIDVRDPESYKQSHIINSVNVNEIFTFLAKSDESGIQEFKQTFQAILNKIGINGDEHIIIYEDNLKTRFGASCRGFFILTVLGLKNIYVLDGGWASWVKAGYPVTEEVPIKTEGTFLVNWNDELWANKSNVVNCLNDDDTTLVDVRDDEEWRAETSSPYGKDFAPRMGRIPKAIHLNWKDLMYVEDNITHIRSGVEVSEICEKKGIKNDKSVIVYCFKGARASNSLIALKRAGFKVKNYFASWNEWSRDFELPIEN